MTTRKKSRRWPVLLAVPVALILILALAVKLYFTDERLRAMVIPEIESATHRSASIGGVSLSLFPDIGITVSDFTLSNPEGTEYPHPHFLSLRTLFIDVKLFPLFRGRLEVNRVAVEGLTVYLDVTTEGKKNYSAGGGARAVAGEPKEDDGGAVGAFLLANMEITDGRIEAHNRRLDTRWTIAGLNQNLRMEGSGGQAPITISGSSEIDSFSYGSGSSWYLRDLPVSAELQLSYRQGDDWLDLRDVRVRLREVPLIVTGSVRDLQQPVMSVDISVESPELGIGHLLSLLPAAGDAGEITATGNAQFSMKILGESDDGTNPSVHASFAVSGGTARYASLSGSITGISLDGTLDIPQAAVGRKDIGDMRIDRFSARLGESTVNGTLRVAGFGDPEIDASLRGDVDLGEVGAYYPLPPGTGISGRVRSDVTLKGKPSEPRSMRASGSMELLGVNISRAGMDRPLRNLDGVIMFNNRLLELRNVSCLLGESDLGLDASVDNYLGFLSEEGTHGAATPSMNFTMRSSRLRTEDFAAPSADSTAAGTGGGEAAGLLFLPGVDMSGTVSVDTLVTEKFTFSAVRGTVSSAGGILKLHQVRLDAFEGTVSTSGTLDLRDPASRPFDLTLKADGVESHSFLAPFTSFANYLFGKLTLSTAMRGVLDDTLGIRAASLTGNGDALISDGRLTGVPLLQSLSGFLDAGNLREVDFRSWTQSFSVADGRVKISDLKIGGKDADLDVSGFHGLDGSLDYALRIHVPREVAGRIRPQGTAGQLLQFFRDGDGGLNFDFLVTGSMDAPALKLDTRAQEDLLRKQLQNDALKKAAEGLKKLIKP